MPLGPATLSRRLPVIGLVGHYPTNYLIGRDPLLRRQLAKQRPAFTSSGCPKEAIWGISTPFGALSPTGGQVSHVLLRRPPVYSSPEGEFRPRLAWLRHAASVSPEPGSNPPQEYALFLLHQKHTTSFSNIFFVKGVIILTPPHEFVNPSICT